tara:strand:+ start:175 stop:429 length:255 start_codon:yes stop_codon:yes gene_type:complete
MVNVSIKKSPEGDFLCGQTLSEDYGFYDRGTLIGEANTLGQPNSFSYCWLYFFMTAVFFNASNSVSALKLRPLSFGKSPFSLAV